jgi:peptide chain release factor 2
MEQLSKGLLEELQKNIEETIIELDLKTKSSRMGELETVSVEPDFWKNQESAKKVMSEIDSIKSELEIAASLESQISDLLQLFEMSNEDEYSALIEDVESLKNELNEFQKFKFLSGKFDNNDAILSIHSGQGGTEANDWTDMLSRMYKRYCEIKGWQYEVQHQVPGNEAGLSTVRILIKGPYAFGSLKRESGTHRLVRLSPFNSQNLRQTSFAGVEVIPLIEDDENEVEIKDEDIDFKAVRSSGAGGQSVNKTSSAVQITHKPTGITVHNSEHRYQAQNRKAAMQILRARIWLIEEEKRLSEIRDIKGEHKIAGWGNQIRNYVLHPYKLVKDLRTKVESNNPDGVLDGDLQEFIDAEIRMG